MHSNEKILVMKFGGASIASLENFDRVAEIIKVRKAIYPHIAIVVSAMGNMTDRLLNMAKQVSANPPSRELDMLVSVGERISIALLAMALDKKGIIAKSFTGSQSGIVTSDEHSDAKIIDVRPKRLLKAFSEGNVVIVAGFQGVSQSGEITTLGRGGSDTSAVALAAAFGSAAVEFYKNVLGVYNKDPHKDPSAKKYMQMSYEEAYDLVNAGAKILHPRSIFLAKKNKITLFVKSFLNPELPGTEITGLNIAEREIPCYESEKENDPQLSVHLV